MNNDSGDGISKLVGDWSFSGDTTNNFDKHVLRSVPFYNEGHDLVCNISDFFLTKNSHCYELGCSTGTLSTKLAEHNSHKDNIKFIGIDIEKDMIDMASSKNKIHNLHFECENILDYDLEKSDLIVSYYTAQFLKGKDSDILNNFLVLLKKREVMAVSPVFGELLQGAKKEKERKIISGFWQNLPKTDEENAFIKAGELSYQQKLNDKGIGLIDAYILAVALENDFSVWTLDKKLQRAIDEIVF